MKLSRIGNITIEPNNNYSENATIRVSAVFANGWYCTAFKGWVDIAEVESGGSATYSQNTTLGAVLPASVNIVNDGYADFNAKSLAEAPVEFTTRPSDAAAITTNYELWPPGVVLWVPQWVDNNANSRADWCEQWADALLVAYQASAVSYVRITTSVVAWIGADYYALSYGRMAWGSVVFYVNPAAPQHRTNAGNTLGDTVLHESRHCFQFWDCSRHVGDDHGEGPDNDDDEGRGDRAPERVYLSDETGIKDVVANGLSGDDVVDPAAVVRFLLELDASSFAGTYR